MSTEFRIVEVLNTRGSSNQQGLVFKVQWLDSNQIAFMQFQMAKKKYPNIVLDYLVSKIKQKPISASQQLPNQSNQTRKSFISPVTQHTEIIIQQKIQNTKSLSYSSNNQIKNFFSQCCFCQSKRQNNKILDYDAFIPIESAFAYAVYFKMPNTIQYQKSLSLKNNRKRVKKE